MPSEDDVESDSDEAVVSSETLVGFVKSFLGVPSDDGTVPTLAERETVGEWVFDATATRDTAAFLARECKLVEVAAHVCRSADATDRLRELAVGAVANCAAHGVAESLLKVRRRGEDVHREREEEEEEEAEKEGETRERPKKKAVKEDATAPVPSLAWARDVWASALDPGVLRECLRLFATLGYRVPLDLAKLGFVLENALDTELLAKALAFCVGLLAVSDDAVSSSLSPSFVAALSAAAVAAVEERADDLATTSLAGFTDAADTGLGAALALLERLHHRADALPPRSLSVLAALLADDDAPSSSDHATVARVLVSVLRLDDDRDDDDDDDGARSRSIIIPRGPIGEESGAHHQLALSPAMRRNLLRLARAPRGTPDDAGPDEDARAANLLLAAATPDDGYLKIS